MAKLKHPTAASVTVDGKTYEVKNGFVEVPDEHAAALVESHGFKTPDQAAAEEAAEVEAKAAQTVRVVGKK